MVDNINYQLLVISQCSLKIAQSIFKILVNK